MNVVEQVKQTAVSSFRNILRASAHHNGRFRMVLTTRTGDDDKPLLIVGNAHGVVEDGHCIAIQNPDKDLADLIRPGCAYGIGGLKEIVSKRCDLALDLWIDAYKEPEHAVSIVARYKARNPQPAKFVVS